MPETSETEVVKLDLASKDVIAERIEVLLELFPEIKTESEGGQIDFDKLRLILGEEVAEGDERYSFTWPGKLEAIRQSQSRSMATLRPNKEKSVDWDNTQNIYIEGDNLEVLKLLQSAYHGQIKMIYIDPPYNTGGDFIYKDKFEEKVENYLAQTNSSWQTNPETGGKYHSKWLSMMYPRLRLAKELLNEEGVIFISIDDNEYSNLKKICDEVFGDSSFVTTLHVEMSATQGMKVKAAKKGNIVKNAEYILVYSHHGKNNIAQTLLYDYRPDYDTHYSKYLEDDDSVVNLNSKFNSLNIGEQVTRIDEAYQTNALFKSFVDENAEKVFCYDHASGFDADEYDEHKVYRIEKGGRNYIIENRNGTVKQLIFLSDSFGECDDFQRSIGLRKIRGDWWKDFYKDMGNVSKEGNVAYPNAKKPVRLIYQLAKMCTQEDDIVMDFFSGSSTTAHAVMQLNNDDQGRRRTILIQLPEDLDETYANYSGEAKEQVKKAIDFLDGIGKPHYITEIGEERIRRAGTAIAKFADDDNRQLAIGEDPKPEPDIGFRVFELDKSSFYEWDGTSEQDLFEGTRLEDRTDEDVLFEVMIKWGLELSLPVEKTTITEYEVYSVAKNALVCCMKPGLSVEVLEEIGQLKPDRVLILDSILDDSLKLNAAQILGTEKLRTV